jgi:hypothetical protein
MKNHDDKEKFLQELVEIPLISVVCRRVGICKATIYRWKEKDKRFAKKLEKALKQGRSSVNDLAEGHIISLIKKGDFRASKLWLENNHKEYVKPRPRGFFEPIHHGVEKIIYEIHNPQDKSGESKKTELDSST